MPVVKAPAPVDAVFKGQEMSEEKKKDDGYWRRPGLESKYDDSKSRWWRGVIGQIGGQEGWTLSDTLALIRDKIPAAEWVLVEWSRKNTDNRYIPVPNDDKTANSDLNIHFLVCLSNQGRPTRVKELPGLLRYAKVSAARIRLEVEPQELVLREPLTQGTMPGGELCNTRYGVWYGETQQKPEAEARRTFEEDVMRMLSEMRNEIREVQARLDVLVGSKEDVKGIPAGRSLPKQRKKRK